MDEDSANGTIVDFNWASVKPSYHSMHLGRRSLFGTNSTSDVPNVLDAWSTHSVHLFRQRQSALLNSTLIWCLATTDCSMQTHKSTPNQGGLTKSKSGLTMQTNIHFYYTNICISIRLHNFSVRNWRRRQVSFSRTDGHTHKPIVIPRWNYKINNVYEYIVHTSNRTYEPKDHKY